MEKVLRTLRIQAWNRAKGELNSMLCTFWGGHSEIEGQYRELRDRITNFIGNVEDEGLHE